MGRDRRPAEELSIEELEALLARKKLEARQARLRQFRRAGRTLQVRENPVPASTVEGFRAVPEAAEEPEARPSRLRRAFNQGLLAVEIAAVLGLVFILFSGVDVLRDLNRELAAALSGPTPSPTPLITAVVLPSGHTPPTSPGGAQPNEAEIPANLRPLLESLPPVPIPTTGPEQARTIQIPALAQYSPIWNSPAPVVQGDGWEQLRRGVGQHIGSANPGQNGNVVLSAHNDIFGELFRDLDKLRPGDEIILTTATREYVYRVTGYRIVEPTEVEVMLPTARPTVTLISCYPYLVDNQRIVVFGELADS
ncbi:MAG: class D sortase [Chloroflexota bacterium]